MKAKVGINLGNHTYLGITSDDHLVMIQSLENGAVSGSIDLGPATMKRFGELQDYLRRLQIHAIEEGAVKPDQWL